MSLDRRQVLAASAAAVASASLASCTSKAAFSARKVLLIDIDDVGWTFFEDCIAQGDAPELAALRSRAREYRNFWAAPVCSVFRAKVLTGLESFRAGNSVGANVPSNNMGPFRGPSGTWITHGMPGRRTKRGPRPVALHSSMVLRATSSASHTSTIVIQALSPGRWTFFLAALTQPPTGRG